MSEEKCHLPVELNEWLWVNVSAVGEEGENPPPLNFDLKKHWMCVWATRSLQTPRELDSLGVTALFFFFFLQHSK